MSSAMGSGSGAMNSYMEGKAQESIYKRQGQMALIESKMAEEASRQKTSRLTSSQRALYAKAGVDISSGSPLLVMSETQGEGELEAQRIRWQGTEQYKMYKYYARLARTAGNAGAVSQGIQSGISTLSMVAGGIGGGMSGGTGRGVSDAMSGNSGQQWGSFITALANSQRRNFQPVKNNYYG